MSGRVACCSLPSADRRAVHIHWLIAEFNVDRMLVWDVVNFLGMVQILWGIFVQWDYLYIGWGLSVNLVGDIRILVGDYPYVGWRLSLYFFRDYLYIGDYFILFGDYLYIGWRLSVYWLEIILIFVGDYLYIGWILSVYWLKIICILVVNYLCQYTDNLRPIYR